MNIENLTPEQIEKAKLCQTAEELVVFAEQEGIELSDAQLDSLSGGACWDKENNSGTSSGVCPYCKNTIVWYTSDGKPTYCPFCGMGLAWKN